MRKRKNIMTTWKEFNPMADMSMRDSFQPEPSPFCQEIIDYLNHGDLVLSSPSCAIDVFTGVRIGETECILTDGEFSWMSTLSYYVQKYNLQIPKELEEKILSKNKKMFH